MKKLSLFLVLFSIISFLMTDCKKDPVPPTLSTSEVSDVTLSTAKAGGAVMDEGGAAVTDKGIAFGLTPDPAVENNHVSAGGGASDFTVDLENLTEATLYYVRAYGTNSAGTSYGNQVSFTTPEATVATVTTRPPENLTFTTATSGGDISGDGGAEITAKGVCWSTSENPTIDSKSDQGNLTKTEDGTGTEGFSSSLTGLTDGTTYYVRAYATNSKGTAYGNQLSFATTTASPATVETKPVTGITSVAAVSGGNITNNGGAEITAKGVCWSTTQNPTVLNSHTTNGTGSETFNSNLSGLLPGTTYYIRAYATNSKGTAYGNQVTFTTVAGLATLTTKPVTEITTSTASSGGDIIANGGAAVTAKGICWSTAVNPTVAGSHTTNGNGNAGFVSNMTGLNENTTYYVRAYATSSAGTAYGNQVSFTTVATTAPVVTTAVLGTITATTAVSGGNVTSDGGSPVTQRGVVWGTAPNPTTAGTRTTNGTGTGVFVSNITGLTNGTVYYVRAYATNSKGTSYGNELSFTTGVADIDGNVYRTVRIGNQVWMAENLKTTRYRNNTPIPFVTSTAVWMALDTLRTPAYTWYDNNLTNKNIGGLYNWFAVGTGNLCPAGWHVPTEAEFETLERTVGVPADSILTWGWRGNGTGTHLKSTSGWTGGNGDNTSGFTATASGYRAWADGSFRGLGVIGYFWLATDDAANAHPESGWYRRLDATDHRIYRATTHKGGGKSIRCLKD